MGARTHAQACVFALWRLLIRPVLPSRERHDDRHDISRPSSPLRCPSTRLRRTPRPAPLASRPSPASRRRLIPRGTSAPASAAEPPSPRRLRGDAPCRGGESLEKWAYQHAGLPDQRLASHARGRRAGARAAPRARRLARACRAGRRGGSYVGARRGSSARAARPAASPPNTPLATSARSRARTRLTTPTHPLSTLSSTRGDQAQVPASALRSSPPQAPPGLQHPPAFARDGTCSARRGDPRRALAAARGRDKRMASAAPPRAGLAAARASRRSPLPVCAQVDSARARPCSRPPPTARAALASRRAGVLAAGGVRALGMRELADALPHALVGALLGPTRAATEAGAEAKTCGG